MTQKRKRELILIAVLCLAALLLLLWQRLGSSKRGMRVMSRSTERWSATIRFRKTEKMSSKPRTAA